MVCFVKFVRYRVCFPPNCKSQSAFTSTFTLHSFCYVWMWFNESPHSCITGSGSIKYFILFYFMYDILCCRLRTLIVTAIKRRRLVPHWWHFHPPTHPQLRYHLKEMLISQVDVSWPPWGFTAHPSARRLSSFSSSWLFCSLLSLFQMLCCFIFLSARRPAAIFSIFCRSEKALKLIAPSVYFHLPSLLRPHFPPPPSVHFFLILFFNPVPSFHAPPPLTFSSGHFYYNVN